MICPKCNNECSEHDFFCFRCGTPLKSQDAPKKGSHWAPLLVLCILSAVGIALFFLIPMAPVAPAVPASDTPWFTVVDGYLYYDESLYTGDRELTVPSEVDGQTVAHIGEGCFKDSLILTTVILPDTVQTIGSSAFSGCVSLRGIHIPEGVTIIGKDAFLNCTMLEAISIPSTVQLIEDSAFEGCGKLFYIFFNGPHAGWEFLYSGYITPYTQVSCTDGLFLHR